jgi:hypothetical protein
VLNYDKQQRINLLVFRAVELALTLLEKMIEAGSAEGVPTLRQKSRDKIPLVRVLLLANAAGQLLKMLHLYI